MKLRFARWGVREMIACTLVCAAGAAAAFAAGWPWAAAPAAALWLFVMNFFRDPDRAPREGGRIVLAPADGKITDVTETDEPDFIKGPAIRIGIFMNVFSVHVNRAPVTGKAAFVEHRPGRFLDARNPRAMTDNEHVVVGLECEEPYRGKLTLRLIAGMFARRVVCDLMPGDHVGAGDRIGMIKLGSRVEVFIPVGRMGKAAVKPGDAVKAGEDTLVRYE